MSKIIEKREDVRDRILSGVDKIVNPVVQTLSPKGQNVLFRVSPFDVLYTNDGATIAKEIQSSDEIEQVIIDVIRTAALRTNSIAGDGTTTTVLLAGYLIKKAFEMIDAGVQPVLLAKNLETMANNIVESLKPIKVSSKEDLYKIALISSGGDKEIAARVTSVIEVVGNDGMVILDNNTRPFVEDEKFSGFIMDSGLFSPEYAQNGSDSAMFNECSVLITDKKLYYQEEAESIVRAALANNISQLVIVAKDFIGKAAGYFAAHQAQNENIKFILVKHTGSTESLSDLAVYLNATLVTEKTGKIVDKMDRGWFASASRVVSNRARTVISGVVGTPNLEERIKYLREEKDKDPENKEVLKRLSSLTSGMAIIRIGAPTGIQAREILFRYEDSLNAARAALKDGYLYGGGYALFNIPNEVVPSEEYLPLLDGLKRAPLEQILKNCSSSASWENFDSSKVYDANKDRFVDVETAGIIDPYNVTKWAVLNAVSVTNAIITSNYIITDKHEEESEQSE